MAGPLRQWMQSPPPAAVAMITTSGTTIVARATAAGRGGIGIVRLSGPACRAIADGLLGAVPAPRHATLRSAHTAAGEPIDETIALYFASPHSYTGEDVLEIHCHGGTVILDLIVQRCIELGACPARPGEFTERAFHNGRLDLAQAEAVADLINAGSRQAALAAARSLQGEFSVAVRGLVEALTGLRVQVEAEIDFPDEGLDASVADRHTQDVGALLLMLDAIAARVRQGRLLRDGVTIAIVGRPNAGKSSLLNRLAEADVAIVTPVPGTTRDVLRQEILIDGLPVHVVDTAGLRATEDPVEAEGVRRARQALERADAVLALVDATEPQQLPTGIAGCAGVTWVLSKIDLTGDPAAARRALASALAAEGIVVAPDAILSLSALTGQGLDDLREHLKRQAGFHAPDAGDYSARQRHADALARARVHIARSQELLAVAASPELVAEDLRLAQRTLGEITGEVTSDDLLGRIFASFCIGK